MLNQKNIVMKKLSFFVMAAVIVAASSMFVSCSDDEVEDPTVSVKATYGANNNVTISPIGGVIEDELGTIVTFNIEFTMGSNKIDEIHIKSTIGGKTFSVLDSVELTKGMFNLKGGKIVEYKYVTNVGIQEETLKFSTLDTKGNGAEFSLTIKMTDPPEPPIIDDDYYYQVSKGVTLLGAQKNASSGSFYSVAYGKVLTVGAATSQPGDVDFAFYYGATNQATIAAPSNTQAQTISYGATKMSSWSTKNDTKFYFIDFGLGEKSDIDPYGLESFWTDIMGSLDGSTDIDSHANQLKKDDLVAFKTKAGKKGVFVVDKVTTGDTGSIEIKFIDRIEL